MVKKVEYWLTPEQAAKLMSEKCGYRIDPIDIRQLRRTDKIPKSGYKQMSNRLFLYNRSVIEQLKAPNKRNKEPYPPVQEEKNKQEHENMILEGAPEKK